MPKKKRKEPAHHPLGASNAKRWTKCYGSPELIKRAPKERPSRYAEEGTVAHALASDYLLGKALHPWDRIGETIKVRPRYARKPMIFVVDEDMVTAVTTYIDFVGAQVQHYGVRPKDVFVEQRVRIPIGIDIYDELFGTADHVIHVAYERLVVTDYKHGAGVVVDVQKNEQAMFYGLGAYFGLPEDIREEFDLIDLNIVQPRAHAGDGIKSDTITKQELLEYHEFLIESVERVVEPDAPLKAGEWCKFCPAKPICPEWKAAAAREAHVDFADVKLPAVTKKSLPDPRTWTPEEVGRFMDNTPMFQDMIQTVWAIGFEMHRTGTRIPGYGFRKRRRTKKWKNEKQARRMLRGVLGPKAFTKRKVISPAQAQKLLKGLDYDFDFERLYEMPDNGYTLAKGADDRDITLAACDFEEIIVNES